MSSLPAGSYQIIANVLCAQDENLLNNELIKSFIVFPPGNNYNDVVINEIMYAPLTGEPEWVELYNRTASPINLKKWKLSDASSSTTITSTDKLIPGNGYIVLSKDSSILNYYNVQSELIQLNLPALNNTGDAVTIKDSIGVKIDSLYYFPTGAEMLMENLLNEFQLNDRPPPRIGPSPRRGPRGSRSSPRGG